MIYNNELQNSNNKLQSILEQINTLPEAGSGVTVETCVGTFETSGRPLLSNSYGQLIYTDKNLNKQIINFIWSDMYSSTGEGLFYIEDSIGILTPITNITVAKNTIMYFISTDGWYIHLNDSIEILLKDGEGTINTKYCILPLNDNFTLEFSGSSKD